MYAFGSSVHSVHSAGVGVGGAGGKGGGEAGVHSEHPRQLPERHLHLLLHASVLDWQTGKHGGEGAARGAGGKGGGGESGVHSNHQHIHWPMSKAGSRASIAAHHGCTPRSLDRLSSVRRPILRMTANY